VNLLLLSSSSRHGSGFLEYCAEEIRDFFSTVTKVVFVPYALHDWNAYTDIVRRRLQEFGFAVAGIHQSDEMSTLLAEADAIYIGGGNTFRLLNLLYEQDLLVRIRERVHEGMLYMGASAGTNVACATIKTTNDMPIVYPPGFDALGLVPFNINPHYLDPDPDSTHQGETREQRIKEFHEMNDNPVIGLREGSYLRLSGNRLTLKGGVNARLFQKNRQAEEYPSGSDMSFLLNGV
jgi:dipeptidase E